MRAIRSSLPLVLLATALWVAPRTLAEEHAAPAPLGEPAPVAKKPLVQLAILLDTSGSMDGLLDQAKTQLWKIVNEFISAKRKGQRPEIQVALYEYGKQSLPASQHFLRQIVPLTRDLDKVSEQLFALRTNGGEEYCGAVIRAAAEGLAWSSSSADLKAIFIAGNEPFTQGTVDYKEACKAAIAKGIVVNTIFCGAHQDGVNTQWEAGAKLADGRFMHIDQNRQAVHIAAPQDREIEELGGRLNSTYVTYGRRGADGKARQLAQDKAAEAAAPAAKLEREVAKGSGFNSAEEWDLVDALKEKKADLQALKVEDLPAEMKSMKEAERKAYVEGKAKERIEIQEKIQKLNEDRKKFVAEELRKRSEKGEDTLEGAMLKAIREEARKKEFTFE